MGLYPINLEIKNKPCVVVGGGSVALRKAKSFMKAGAQVKVVSPEVIAELRALGQIEFVERSFERGDLEGALLAIAATDNEAVNKEVAADAYEHGVLLNVVDKPGLCHFFVPSVVKRGDLVISISTRGKFPGLSKKLRKKLEEEFGSEYEKYLELLANARNKVIAKYADLSKRKAKLQEIADLDLIRLIKQGKIEEAQEKIEKVVEGSTPDSRLPTLD